LFSVFGFGFSFLCDSRLCGVVVVAIYPHLKPTTVGLVGFGLSRPVRVRPNGS
jgi:hypothetical protein